MTLRCSTLNHVSSDIQDDCWQVARNATGSIVADPVRFPNGIAALADEIHNLGLKLGLYTSRSSLTCQDRPASYDHEALDCASYCDWNLDYIKVRKGDEVALGVLTALQEVTVRVSKFRSGTD